MPNDIPGGDFEGCVRVMQEDEGHDEDTAEDICGVLQQEAKNENGDASELLDAFRRASGAIMDVGVDFNSAVDVPAINSKWTMFKSTEDGYNRQVDTPLVMKQSGESEKRISFAPAMIPREPDKEGDVVPTPVVENAAHGYLASDGDVDTDHSLIDGKGEVVESWIEPSERTWDLPDGGTETYPAGTWMVGIKWAKDPWERIQSGELTGLSIYGKADHVPLQRSATSEVECPDCGARVRASTSKSPDTHKGDGSESGGMGQDSTSDAGAESADAGKDTDADAGGGDGPTLKDVTGELESLAESVDAVKDAVETEKADEQEAAAMLAESYGMEPGDVLDVLTVAQGKDPEQVIDAVDSIDANSTEEEAKEDGEDDEEDEGDESEKSDTAEKRADDAHLGKGGDATGTASKGVSSEGGATSSGELSYQALAEQHGGDN